MDKLEQIKQKIEELQTKTLVANDLKAFVTLVLSVVKETKSSVEKLSSENMMTLQQAINYMDAEHNKLLNSVTKETSTLSDDFAKSIEEVKKLIAKVKTIKPKNGIDGKDGVNPNPKDVVPLVLEALPPQKELDGEEIANKLEALEGEAKLDFKALKNVPVFKGGKSGGVVARNIYQMGDVSLTSLANNDVLKWDDTNKLWVNGTGGSGGTWGSITGTLSNQTDLQNALDALVPYSGATGDVTLGTHALTVHNIKPDASDGLLIESNNGTDIGLLGAGNTANVTWYGNHNFNTVTASRVAQFGASKTLESSSVTTTELGYLSGVTSAIQTQLNAKEPSISTAGATTVWHGDKTFSAVVEADITLSDNATNNVSTAKHGFMSKLPGGTTLFYRADGSFAAPASVAVPNGYLQEAFAYLAATPHSIAHNFGAYPVVQAFDSTGSMVVPLTIQNTDVNTVAITFTSAGTYTLVLTIGSPQLQAYTSTAIDYTAGVTDRIIAVTAAAKTITLPTANVSNAGYEYKIDNSSTGNIFVVGQGGELIQGQATQTVPPDSCLSIYANGTVWRID